MDLTAELPKEIGINLRGIYWQKIVYDNLPTYYLVYNMQGHTNQACQHGNSVALNQPTQPNRTMILTLMLFLLPIHPPLSLLNNLQDSINLHCPTLTSSETTYPHNVELYQYKTALATGPQLNHPYPLTH